MRITDSFPTDFKDLPASSASTVKTAGWRGITRALEQGGRLLITNHNEPQAVILTPAEYSRLIAASQRTSARDPLEALRAEFDARLATLAQDDAAERLRTVSGRAPQLKGAVKAGATY